MSYTGKFLTVALASLLIASCTLDEIEIPSSELLTREFIRNFGVMDENHDWSLYERQSVTVTVPGTTDVMIYALNDGETTLVGQFANVSGTQELKFDCPKGTETVVVRTANAVQATAVSSAVSFTVASNEVSVTSSSDKVYDVDEVYTVWDHAYVEAFTKVLPEGGHALENKNIVTDFSFVSDGNPFEFYPVYWNTSAKNTLGVYWYENGVLKTQDLYEIKQYEADGTPYEHTMYRKGTLSASALTLNQPTELSQYYWPNRYEKEGVIQVTFNRPITTVSADKIQAYITLNGVKVADIEHDNVSGKTISFKLPAFSDKENKLLEDRTYNLVVPAKSVYAADGVTTSNDYNELVSVPFTTPYYGPVYQESSIDGATGVSTSGTFTVTYESVRTVIENYSYTQKLDGEKILLYKNGAYLEDKSGNKISLVAPSVSGSVATYTYSGLATDTDYTFYQPENEFTSDYYTASGSKELTLTFSTGQPSPQLNSDGVTITGGQTAAMTSGEIDLNFTTDVVLLQSAGKATITDADGNVVLSFDVTQPAAKVANFKYSGLELATTYTFTLPANGFSCKGYTKGNDEISFEFTTNELEGEVITFKSLAAGASQTDFVDSYPDNCPISLSLDINSTLSLDQIFTTNKYSVTVSGETVDFSNTILNKVSYKTDNTYNSTNYAYIDLDVSTALRLYIIVTKAGAASDSGVERLDVRQQTTQTTDDDATIYIYNKLTTTRPSNLSSTDNQYYYEYVDIQPGTYRVSGNNNIHIGGFVYTTTSGTQSSAAKLPVKFRIAKSNPVSVSKAASTSCANRSRASRADESTNLVTMTKSELTEAGYDRLSTYLSTSSLESDASIASQKITLNFEKNTVFGFYIRNNSGATGKNESAYQNYSMSSLNKSSRYKSFFAGAISAYDNGWNSSNTDSSQQTPLEGREYSTAATYTVDVNGDGDIYRYFSFEDYVDCDFNDVVFMVAPESTASVVDYDVYTNPYIFAVEDLGASKASDLDFNDLVFAVEHKSGHDYAFVTMLAAGGTLKARLYYYYGGNLVEINGTAPTEIVAGPKVGSTVDHINQWFDLESSGIPVNVGSPTGRDPGFDNLTTVKIPVDKNFSLTADSYGTTDGTGHLNGFVVEVERTDGTLRTITRPNFDQTYEAPQMLILPDTWYWPLEGVDIKDAYSGGVTSDNTSVPSFEKWVSDATQTDWYKLYVESSVKTHSWSGSAPAKEYINSLENSTTTE